MDAADSIADCALARPCDLFRQQRVEAQTQAAHRHHRFGAVGNIQCAQDRGDVDLDGSLVGADRQANANPRIHCSSADAGFQALEPIAVNTAIGAGHILIPGVSQKLISVMLWTVSSSR